MNPVDKLTEPEHRVTTGKNSTDKVHPCSSFVLTFVHLRCECRNLMVVVQVHCKTLTREPSIPFTVLGLESGFLQEAGEGSVVVTVLGANPDL